MYLYTYLYIHMLHIYVYVSLPEDCEKHEILSGSECIVVYLSYLEL